MVDTPMNTSRRKMMLQAVSLFSQEAGFQSIERTALEFLTEMFQANFVELGRSTRMFTEVAGRVEPTVGDLTMAFIDMGFKVDPAGLRGYARRHTRPILPAPHELPLPKLPTILTAGNKRPLPSYIPDFFPAMPDPQAYIRTPTHRQPITDYAACREKTSQQKRDLERSLSKFFARTSPCYYLFPENKSLFPLISTRPVTYIDPLCPKDQMFDQDQILQPLNTIKKEKLMEAVSKLNDDDEDENGGEVVAPTSKMTTSYELIDNPYLKPVVPKKMPPGNRLK